MAGAEVFYPGTLSPILIFTTPEALPAHDDEALAGDDYFIVIRTSDEITDGDDFTVSIETDAVWVIADFDDVFVDADGATTSGAGADPGLAGGTALVWFDAADNVYWEDINADNRWDGNEGIFIDANDNGIFDIGELEILDTLANLITGDIGTEASGFAVGGLAYNDANGDGWYAANGTEAIYFMGVLEGANAILSVFDPDWTGFEGTVTTDTITCEAWADDYTPMRAGMEHPDDEVDLYRHSVPDENIRPRPDSGPNVMEEVYADVLKAQLLPLETRIPVLAINAASRGQLAYPPHGNDVRLTRVRITFSRVNQDSSFDPETGLDPLFHCADWLPYSGVAIYADTNDNGIFDEGIDTPLVLDWASWGAGPVIVDVGGNNTWQVTLDLYNAGYVIEPHADGNDDFFIVIRLDSGYTDRVVGDGLGVKYGTDFIAYIRDGDVNFDSGADPSFPSNCL